MLTAYDATFAAVADAAGVECLLVGDSLGMVCQEPAQHGGRDAGNHGLSHRSVARGLRRVQGTVRLIADLPYGSYAESREQALQRRELMRAGAHMVKLEGGGWTAPTVCSSLVPAQRARVRHPGPHAANGACTGRLPGCKTSRPQTLRRHAHELQDAGATMLVLEMVPALLSAEHWTQELQRATPSALAQATARRGQVLVLHDMLGLNLEQDGCSCNNFIQDADSVRAAPLEAYVQAVVSRPLPRQHPARLSKAFPMQIGGIHTDFTSCAPPWHSRNLCLRAHHGQPARQPTWPWCARPGRWATRWWPASSSTARGFCRTGLRQLPAPAGGRRQAARCRLRCAVCPSEQDLYPSRKPSRNNPIPQLADILEGRFRQLLHRHCARW